MTLFEWNPNLSIVACVWEDEQIGFFRIKHDTKKWIYCDALIENDQNEKTKDSSLDSDSTEDSIIAKNKSKNFKVIHMNWLNEGDTLYYVTNDGILKFFDFNLTENHLKLITILQIKDQLTNCIEVYSDQHSDIYLSSKKGTIYLVNELTKNVTKLMQLKCSILKMLYFKRSARLVLINDEFVLYQYDILNHLNNQLQNQSSKQQKNIEMSSVKLEVFSKSLSHIEKLVDKRKSKKGKLQTPFRQDDIFVLKIDEHFNIIGICVAGERVIRLFQIDSGQNLAVIAIESTDYQWSGVSYLIYNENLQLLLAGTSNNQFFIWKRNVLNIVNQNSSNEHSDDNHDQDSIDESMINQPKQNQFSKQFEFNKLAQFLFDGPINCITVNKHEVIGVISNSISICIVEKQTLNFSFLNGLAVVQLNARELKLIWLNENRDLIVNLGEIVKEVFLNLSLNKLAVKSNNKSNELTIVDIKDYDSYEIIRTLQVQNFKIILQENYLWQLNLDLNKTKVLTNNQGLSLNCFHLLNDDKDEQQIYPIDLEKSFKANERVQLNILDCMSNHLLIVIQSESLIQNYCYLVYELNANQASLKCKPTMIIVDDQIMDAKINSDGTLITIIDNNQVHLLKVGSDELQTVRINFQKIDQVFFSSNEPRLLCIQSGQSILILICYLDKNSLTDKINYQLYDRRLTSGNSKLIGFQIPFVYILKKDENLQILKESLNEFNEIDIRIVRLIIDFLTVKRDLNLMIKKINKINQSDENESLWLNLARISVKCKNVEMGLYCMGKLKNVRVIRDVQNELRSKLFDNESRNNLALGVLAINLNLFHEAEELFKLSNQNLKLVEFYQSRNDWPIALKTIEKLNERSVFYDCAKYYENELNDIDNAIKCYEKSSTYDFEVTRMLFDLNELVKLKQYCFNGKLVKKLNNEKDNDQIDKKEADRDEKIKLNNLKRWWGQYCESLGDFQSSLKAYQQAKDYYNQVRLLCLMGNLDDAKKVVNGDSFKNLNNDENQIKSTNDEDKLNFLSKHNNLNDDEKELERRSKNAAMLQIGKHLESIDPAEAVQYYLHSGAINHAIRICKSNQFDNQLVKIIQNYGSRNEIIDVLKKLDENEDNYENLFNLYLKIDMVDKALKIGKGLFLSTLSFIILKYTFFTYVKRLSRQIMV